MKEFKFKVFLKVVVIVTLVFLSLHGTMFISMFLSSLLAEKNTSQFNLQTVIFYIFITAFCIDKVYVPVTIKIMNL